jgi:hypothetical protein
MFLPIGNDTYPLTWDDVLNQEPRLAELLADAKEVDASKDPDYCRHAYFDSHFKPRILKLVRVGRRTESGIYASSESCEVALQTILEALPDCRHSTELAGCIPFPRRRRKQS